MPFVSSANVMMADGGLKNIALIRQNEYVMDMTNTPVRVRNLVTAANQSVVNLTLNNSTGAFKITPSQLVYATFITAGNRKTLFTSISSAHSKSAQLKHLMNIFVTAGNIGITTYDNSNPLLTSTVYSLDLWSENKTYLVNGVIVKYA